MAMKTDSSHSKMPETFLKPTTQQNSVKKTLSLKDIKDFTEMYPVLVNNLAEMEEYSDMSETTDWLVEALEYNTLNGKCVRGLGTVLAYKYLSKDLMQENIRLSYVLGWCVEIAQAACLVADDIMDEAETRRGKPCWYKRKNLGASGFNDTLLLKSAMYFIIRMYFKEKPYYKDLISVYHRVLHETIYGQSLDTLTGYERRMELYTSDRYSAIVKYKTSLYTFYLPVRLAMILAGVNDPKIIEEVKEITLKIGHLFQVQDDYLDCFGDEKVTGKIGTDIQDCKCSWLFVTAMEKCSKEQKQFLMDNYGQHDTQKVEKVKCLYRELEIPKVFKEYEEMAYKSINNDILNLDDSVPQELFVEMVNKIYRRDH